MAEENYGFAQTRARLEDIVAQVRKKDVSLEKSLDLLEEGVRLANQCTELIDHADWEAGEVSEPDTGDVGERAENLERDAEPGATGSDSQAEAGAAEAGGEDEGAQ